MIIAVTFCANQPTKQSQSNNSNNNNDGDDDEDDDDDVALVQLGGMRHKSGRASWPAKSG